MAKTKVSDWDATAALNTEINSISTVGTAAVSNFDNAFREMMSQWADVLAGTDALPDTTPFGDPADLTKRFRIDVGNVTTATTRVLTLPDQNVTITAAGAALLDDASASAQRTTMGLGTIATQSAASVAITGGTANGMSIGATTPSTGAFTTISATGDVSFTTAGKHIIGGFGASNTSGTLDWDDSTNARPGNGYTLLLGTATNGPGGAVYFHPFSFEYASKDGTGNMTQFAIPYTTGPMYLRTRSSGTWSNWRQILTADASGLMTTPGAFVSTGNVTTGGHFATPASAGYMVRPTGEDMGLYRGASGELQLLEGGNVIYSYGQVKFPATQAASADANTLDDYEQGSFTPTVAFGGGSVGLTYSSQSGTYTKIGRQVFCHFLVTLTAKGSSTGTFALGGLPYSAATANNMGGHVVQYSNLSSVPSMIGIRGGTATTLFFYYQSGGAATTTAFTDARFTDTSTFLGFFMYEASA